MAGVPRLLEADRVEVLVVMDNAVDPLSTNPPNVRPELGSLVAAGMTEWSGESCCVGHHGLSLLVTAFAGDAKHTVLFDFGPEGATLLRNADRLRADLAGADDFVLSHGHWDHAGGLLAAVGAWGQKRAPAKAPVHMHPGMFVRRGVKLPDGTIVPFGPVPSAAAIADAGGAVVLATGPRLLGSGVFALSGEIPRRTAYEQGFPNHVREGPPGAWQPDPLIVDERFLVVRVKGKGLVVFTACSHAGVVNVARHARELVPDAPLHAVMGGFHLAGVGPETIIGETVRDLAGMGFKLVAPGHCTGWRAAQALVTAVGSDVVAPLAVGKRYAF